MSLRKLTPSRREFLTWVSATFAWATLDGCSKPDLATPAPQPIPKFFTDEERDTLSALADAVIPPDAKGPGGAALGTVAFVERLCTAFEMAEANLYASGPYSGRNPEPGTESTPWPKFPENDFAKNAPLDRVQERSFRLYLYGSDGVEGGGPNDAVLGKIEGLRDRLKRELAKALATAGKPLSQLDAKGRADALAGLDEAFHDELLMLVCQAAFSAPEYGGNPDRAGWNLMHFEGDSQPLGYAYFSEAKGDYVERADAPLSGPNPGADPEPMDQQTRDFIAGVVNALGGKEFP